ncbi:NAD(+) synthase [Vallitaleaceae bacterium 9-2]
MNSYGFSRVANGIPIIKLGDINYNLQQIKNIYDQACNHNVDLIIMPELCITGYSLGDLLHQSSVLNHAKKGLDELLNYSLGRHTILVVGLPMLIDESVYNVAAIIYQGELLGIVPKSYLPTYNEFYESRWFGRAEHLTIDTLTYNEKTVPVGADLVFKSKKAPYLSFAIEICEDLWAPVPPSTFTALAGALVIGNLSASNERIGKYEYRRDLVKGQSARHFSSYVYSSCGYGESTTDVVYGGHALIAENGRILVENNRFELKNQFLYHDIDLDHLRYDRLHSSTYRECKKTLTSEAVCRTIHFDQGGMHRDIIHNIPKHPFVPSSQHDRTLRCEEIFNIQTHGLAKRLNHIGEPKAVIGISGGLDSTLALLVTVKTFDLLNRKRKDIIGVTMPGFGTTGRTYKNAMDLMKALHITILEVPISDAVTQHFKDIDHDINTHDITYENSQARERTKILMDLANKYKGLVIGTGDLSELALGWATYNGDHMSMYGVNTSIPKTLVHYLVEWVSLHEETREAKLILCDILNTPVSPELLPPSSDGKISQKTEEVVGPYELHDFFLYYMMRFGYSPSKIMYLATHAFKDIYTSTIIYKWLSVFYRRFFAQQFKRSALPDGPKVGSICLSPRGDLRMPSDAVATLWLEELESIHEHYN